MIPHVKNVLLASSDQVAIDAVAAKLMGFDPLKDVKYIRLAHEMGLGCGDVRDIELVGDVEAGRENWNFEGPFANPTFASASQRSIYWGKLKKPIEWSLRTWLAPWAYLASVGYHDLYWYPRHGRGHLRSVLDSEWGRLFANWDEVVTDPDGKGYPDVGEQSASFIRGGKKHFLEGIRLLGMALVESPEFRARGRRQHT
jgi:hypothetical protein